MKVLCLKDLNRYREGEPSLYIDVSEKFEIEISQSSGGEIEAGWNPLFQLYYNFLSQTYSGVTEGR